MTPLRQRFCDDLRLRNRSPQTIEAYVLAVNKFAKHFGKSPELLGPSEIRQYQLHLIDHKVSWSQFNQGVCALRFLYNVTLGRPHVIKHLPFAKRPRTLPDVLTRDEVAQLLTAALPGRDRTILELKYSCGLRLRELLGLQVRDIDSARMALHIRRGKGMRGSNRCVSVVARSAGASVWSACRCRVWCSIVRSACPWVKSTSAAASPRRWRCAPRSRARVRPTRSGRQRPRKWREEDRESACMWVSGGDNRRGENNERD